MRLWIAIALVACTASEHRDAREKYNAGVDAMVKADFETAEKSLLDARSTAGVDPELRFRAAYDLGMTYAAHADKLKAGKDADLDKALELEQQAVSWFSDAVRLRDDKDAKANLAIVRARAQALSDELRKGEGKLEARLDRLIADQGGVLDEARAAWVAIKQAGGADPLAQQGTLTHLADKERGVVADAGVVGDMASEDIDSIGKKPEDKRKPDEKQRLVQLENLDQYLLDGRGKIAEARRKLQDLAAEDAVGRAEAALVALKRAREQLLDPITILREVAKDQLQLIQETHAVAEATATKLGETKPDKPVIPAWLEPPALGDRQAGLHERVDEVRARVAAAVEHAEQPAGTGSAAEPPKLSEEQAKVIAQLAEALPHVVAASGAMDKARGALTDKKLADAGEQQRTALDELARAIELFADLKQTIDLASETQKEIVQLLSPDAAKQMSAAERTTETRDALTGNTQRMGRIKQLLADEVAKLDKQGQAIEAQAGSGSGAPDPKQVEAGKQQLAQAKDQLAQAETLRGEADKLIGELTGAIKANKDPLTPAKAANAKLDELRRLFFTVIEHLKDLIRQQGETRDQTSQASGEDDFTRGPKLPALAGREDGHAQMAKAITDALAKQADAAAKQPQQQGGIPPKSLSAAADEVRLAQGDMTDARTAIGKAQGSTTQTISLDPAVKSEAKAIEHLENALKLLEPPKQQQNQEQQQQQQQQQQDKKDQQQQQQQQQGGAGQRARDDDARRQREKQQRESQGDPVDKDW